MFMAFEFYWHEYSVGGKLQSFLNLVEFLTCPLPCIGVVVPSFCQEQRQFK